MYKMICHIKKKKLIALKQIKLEQILEKVILS